MFLTKSRKANLDANEAAARARAAGKAAQVAAQNAADAARAAAASAQATAQNAAQKSQAAAQNAAQKSQAAAQNVGNTAQTTAAGVSKQVQQGVYTARKWAAPKLESVADYTAGTVAPTVSSALRNTAAQVRPAEPVSPARRRVKSAITWSLLGLAVTAAAGAVAALVRYRQRAATEIESQAPDGPLGDTAADIDATPVVPTPVVPASSVPKTAPPKTAPPKPTEPPAAAAETTPNASANQTDTAADASVNGHAKTSGW